MRNGENAHGISDDTLKRWIAEHRRMAETIHELNQRLRSLHPETISPFYWTPLRSALLDFLVESERRSLRMADRFAEVLDEHDHPRCDYSG
jgi:hypothetical protein